VARIAAYEVANETVKPELRTALQQLVAALAQQEQAAVLVQEAMARLDAERRATLQACLQ
jgi:ribosomal protein S20